MQIYAFGGGLDCCVGVGPLFAEVASFYAVPIAGETPGCVAVNNANSHLEVPLRDPVTNAATSIAEGWFHFRHVPGYNAGDNQIVGPGLANSSGTPVFRIVRNIQAAADTFTYQAQYWNGTAWVAAFSGTWTVRGAASAFDLYVKIAVAGSIQIYADGTTIGSVSGIDTSGMSNIATLTLTNGGDGGWGYWGWIVGTGESTIGHLCRLKQATANGANVSWTGGFADVGEYPVNDADYIRTATAGLKSNFTGPDFAALISGHKIKAVGIGARARNSGTVPSTLRGTLTIGGTDYTTADCVGVGAGYGPARMLFPLDPSTGLAWGTTIADANVPFGVESRT